MPEAKAVTEITDVRNQNKPGNGGTYSDPQLQSRAILIIGKWLDNVIVAHIGFEPIPFHAATEQEARAKRTKAGLAWLQQYGNGGGGNRAGSRSIQRGSSEAGIVLEREGGRPIQRKTDPESAACAPQFQRRPQGSAVVEAIARNQTWNERAEILTKRNRLGKDAAMRNKRDVNRLVLSDKGCRRIKR